MEWVLINEDVYEASPSTVKNREYAAKLDGHATVLIKSESYNKQGSVVSTNLVTLDWSVIVPTNDIRLFKVIHLGELKQYDEQYNKQNK